MTNWIPMRWPGGRRWMAPASEPALAARQRWLQPESLKLLAGTCVNCLVVDWAAGSAEDAAEQKAIAPLLSAAQTAKLSTVGLVSSKADLTAATQSAKAAGLSAVVTEGGRTSAGTEVIPMTDRGVVPWKSTSPVLVVSGSVWPGITRAGGWDDLKSGPTQAAWIDSNGWFVQMGRALGPSKKLWLHFEPPVKPNVVTPADYVAAILDSESQGAHWMISLDDEFRDGLMGGNADAAKGWQEMSRTLAFFRKHQDWSGYNDSGIVGILSDFSGHHQDLAFELLNLTSRRHIPYRVLNAALGSAAPLAGLKTVVAMDSGDQPRELRDKLNAFIRQGGLVMAGSKTPPQGELVKDLSHPRFDVRRVGNGRLAICKEDEPDPYMIAIDTQTLSSRTNDVLRFFNTTSVVANLQSSTDGAGALLQMVMYSSMRRSHPPLVWFNKPYRNGRLWRVDQDDPVQLKMQPELGGVSALIPEAAPYLAIELNS